MFGLVQQMRTKLREDKDMPTQNTSLSQLASHVPNIVAYANHSRVMPWESYIQGVLVFADVSGFTSLCEKYTSLSKKGIDELTNTLNGYLGSMVQFILASDGDILKFAGDAILALWKVTDDDPRSTVGKAIKCCLDIQESCGSYQTSIGVTLTVKMGVSVGEICLSYVGNGAFRHYVESGPAVDEVKLAEQLCKSGDIIVSPLAVTQCNMERFTYEYLGDKQHVKIMSMKTRLDPIDDDVRTPILPKRRRRFSMGVQPVEVVPELMEKKSLKSTSDFPSRRTSVPIVEVAEQNDRVINEFPGGKFTRRQTEPAPAVHGKINVADFERLQAIATAAESGSSKSVKPAPDQSSNTASTSKLTVSGLSVVQKLRRAVSTIGEISTKLRLYIAPPVLKKLDDGQPLEYLSEMRQISVIFMNLELNLNNGMSITYVMQILFESVFQKSRDVHGCLNKIFMFDKGCSFLVIFGFPGFKHDDDTANALQCSAKLQKELRQNKNVSLVSIGVTTGMAFCGVVGHDKRHEYSVIGSKVNMAARLMMHYPGKITCDDETFRFSRMPPSSFEVVPIKEMKGMKNIATIRELVIQKEGSVTRMGTFTIPRSKYPILGRRSEMNTLLSHFADSQCHSNRNHDKGHLIIVEGTAGMGKTRFLDAVIDEVLVTGARVISCALDMNSVTKPYHLLKLLLRMLLMDAGYMNQIDQEVDIMHDLEQYHLSEYVKLLEDMLGFKMSSTTPRMYTQDKTQWSLVLHSLIRCLVETSLKRTGSAVIIIDNMIYADHESWQYLRNICYNNSIFTVMSARPTTSIKDVCPEAAQFFQDSEVGKISLGKLDLKYMCGLACQILDVTRIPEEINRILHDQSNGAPYWCEQLLQDLACRNLIQIIKIPIDGESIYHDITVAPLQRYIIMKLNSELSQPNTEEQIEKKRTPEARSMRDKIDLGQDKEVGPSDGVEESLVRGLCLDREDLQVTENICILAPGVRDSDIPIPESIKDMVIAKLDELKASDQLIVRCASVLGITFHTSTLKAVIPYVLKDMRANLRIQRLMKAGVFECANRPVRISREKASLSVTSTASVASMASLVSDRSNYSGLSQVKCFCPNVLSKKSGVICELLRFKNPTVQEIVFDMLLQTQKVSVHRGAAEHLDGVANKHRKSIPYYYLGLPPAAISTCEEMRDFGSEGTTEGAQDELDREEDQRWENLRPCRADMRAISVINITQAALESAIAGKKMQFCLNKLMSLYTQIANHWRTAGEIEKVIHVLLEATAGALAQEQPMQASSLIDDAESVFQELLEKDKQNKGVTKDIVLIEAKIQRLQGEINFSLGFISKAKENILKALLLHGISMPSKRAIKNCKLRIGHPALKRKWFSFAKWKSQHEQTTRSIEIGYCYSQLYELHKLSGDDAEMLFYADKQYLEAKPETCNQHQVVRAYMAIIEQCRKYCKTKIALQLEQVLLKRCKEKSDELSADDLHLLAAIFGESAHVALTLGLLQDAAIAGKFAGDITVKSKLYDGAVRFLPPLFHTQLRIMSFTACVETLYHLRKAIKENPGTIKHFLAWFYSCCLDFLLEAGHPVELFENTMVFASWMLNRSEDIKFDPLTCHYFFMALAVWYARRRNWRIASLWYQAAHAKEPRFCNNYLAAKALARRGEFLMLSLVEALRQNRKDMAEKIHSEIVLVMYSLNISKKMINEVLPRFYHLHAYLCAIYNNKLSCKRNIKKCIKLAKSHGNLLEIAWAMYNYREWTSPGRATWSTISSSVWLCYSDGHANVWYPEAKVTDNACLYPWPLPTDKLG